MINQQSYVEKDYYTEFNSMLNTIKTRSYANRFRGKYFSQSSGSLEEKESEILKDDFQKLTAILSKTLQKNSGQTSGPKTSLKDTAGSICEVLDFLQVHFPHNVNNFITQDVPEELTEFALQYKLILNATRFLNLQGVARDFLLFSLCPSSFEVKKLAELDLPFIYQYYKDRLQNSQNEFKETYHTIANRNDDLSVWLKNTDELTEMIESNNDDFLDKWDKVKKGIFVFHPQSKFNNLE
jgi:hypothetical protein